MSESMNLTGVCVGEVSTRRCVSGSGEMCVVRTEATLALDDGFVLSFTVEPNSIVPRADLIPFQCGKRYRLVAVEEPE